MNTSKVIAQDGLLYLTSALLPAPVLLLRIYPAGDADTILWPMSAKDRGNLAVCLFDARETGELPGDVQEVELPDGSTFAIDTELAAHEASEEGQKEIGYWYG